MLSLLPQVASAQLVILGLWERPTKQQRRAGIDRWGIRLINKTGLQVLISREAFENAVIPSGEGPGIIFPLRPVFANETIDRANRRGPLRVALEVVSKGGQVAALLQAGDVIKVSGGAAAILPAVSGVAIVLERWLVPEADRYDIRLPDDYYPAAISLEPGASMTFTMFGLAQESHQTFRLELPAPEMRRFAVQ